MLIFLIEAFIICLLFTLICVLTIEKSKERLEYVRMDYPPKIVERLIELGKMERKEMPTPIERIAKKWPAMIVLALILGLVVKYLNGAEGFIKGFLLSYALWTVVDWYDAFVIDCIWFCHTPRAVIEATEAMVSSYYDYAFHIKGSLWGMVIGLSCSLIAGLFVEILP